MQIDQKAWNPSRSYAFSFGWRGLSSGVNFFYNLESQRVCLGAFGGLGFSFRF